MHKWSPTPIWMVVPRISEIPINAVGCLALLKADGHTEGRREGGRERDRMQSSAKACMGLHDRISCAWARSQDTFEFTLAPDLRWQDSNPTKTIVPVLPESEIMGQPTAKAGSATGNVQIIKQKARLYKQRPTDSARVAVMLEHKPLG